MESDQANLLLLSVSLLYLIAFVSAQIYPKVRSEVRRKIKIRREARVDKAAEEKRPKEAAKEAHRPSPAIVPYWNRPSTKTPDESSSGKPFGATQALVNHSEILFILSLIAILFLPIAPIESDITSIPGHNYIMSEGGGGLDWKNDGISDQSQFRSGLWYCFGFGLFGLLVGGLICLASPHLGGLVMVVAFFGGTVMWLWGTLALGFFEILAGNPYWSADLGILIGSFVLEKS